MKITDLRTHLLFDGWRNLVFVELETDAGITGIGEATLANRTEAVVAYLHAAKEKHVVGSDPFDTEALWRRIYLGDFIRGGMVACAGLSAIDIACHDIQAKALGVPLYKLLGGTFREAVPCYANGWYTVERALSVAIVRAVREAVGPDVDVYVEAHARFARVEAIRLCRLLEPFNIGWFEEPCPWDDPLSWREVKDKVGVPISGGEHFCTRWGFRTVIEHRCVDILQPDVLYCGGVSEMRKLCAWAGVSPEVSGPTLPSGLSL